MCIKATAVRTPVNDYKIPCIPKDTHSLGAIQNLKLDNDEDYSKLFNLEYLDQHINGDKQTEKNRPNCRS